MTETGTETEKNAGERLRALEERVAKLEKRLAAIAAGKKPAAGGARSYRDAFDALDYPER